MACLAMEPSSAGFTGIGSLEYEKARAGEIRERERERETSRSGSSFEDILIILLG